MHIATIVVGVDGSAASHAGLRLAIDEAMLRTTCRVVMIACWVDLSGSRTHDPDSVRTAQTIAYDALDAVAATEHERSLIVVESGVADPGEALVRASLEAELLVVGSTSRGELARRLGMTTVDHCLRHSIVPVVVVPPPVADPADVDVEIELHQGAPGALR